MIKDRLTDKEIYEMALEKAIDNNQHDIIIFLTGKIRSEELLKEIERENKLCKK